MPDEMGEEGGTTAGIADLQHSVFAAVVNVAELHVLHSWAASMIVLQHEARNPAGTWPMCGGRLDRDACPCTCAFSYSTLQMLTNNSASVQHTAYSTFSRTL